MRISDGGFRGRQRGYVDRERRRSAAKDRERFYAGDDGAEAKPRESRGLGKRSRHEQLRVLVDPWNDRETRKLGVGFIDNDGSVRGGFQNRFDNVFLQQSPGGIVGIAEEQSARLCSERPRALRRGEIPSRVVALNFDLRARHFSPVAVHRESRLADHDTASGIDERVKENAERIIAAVGEQKFFGRHLKMTRETASAALIFGIHRKKLRREFRQSSPDRGRAARSVFVEVEADFVGSALAGRFVGAAIKDCLSNGQLRFHLRTFIGEPRRRWRVRASLRPAPILPRRWRDV